MDEIKHQDYRIRTVTDQLCLPCLIAAGGNDAYGVTVNEQDKLILIQNVRTCVDPSDCDFVEDHNG